VVLELQTVWISFRTSVPDRRGRKLLLDPHTRTSINPIHQSDNENMPSPTPFKIHVPDSLLEQTKHKLSSARLPDQLDGVNWEGNSPVSISPPIVDGTPVAEIERLRNHWLNNYDWRTHEAKINELPQFTIPIDMDDFGEMTIHFVHQRSSRINAIPLIFIHGWPGSFHEVHKILPLLTDPPAGEQAFHVVAPRSFPPTSINFFGFTSGNELVSPDTVGARTPRKRASILEK